FIHLAWVGSSGPKRTDYNLQINNALWTVQCMEVAKALGCARFVCAGSIMEKEVMAIINQQGIRPAMGYIYGLGKLVAHSLCKSLASQLEIDLVWAVITNAYGVGELSPRFINTTLRKIINKESLNFTEASQNYDFVYITDVAEAFYSISKKGMPYCEYLIGSSNPRPLKNFINELAKSVSYDKELTFGSIPYNGVNLPLSTYDTSKTEKDTGFKAKVSFVEGVCKTMEWLKEIAV
ncbi:MAG: NAD-dependent epimerase/dehydratase family protein, partial [Clostridiales bacterium]|nr:NAD-dependent epimerase/dehydratase family protein [Clostridiales bacterium]